MSDITHFVSILVPPAQILSLADADPLSGVWRQLSNKEDSREGKDPSKDDHIAANKAAVTELDALHEMGNNLFLAKREKLNTWFKDVITALRSLLGDHPDPNHLYLIQTSEFALNGVRDEVNDGQPLYGAKFPLPERFETYLRDTIHAYISVNFSKLHVAFAFSCCTFRAEFESRLDKANVRVNRLSCANRFTIVTSTGTSPKQVAKFFPNDDDSWPTDFAMPRPNFYRTGKDPLPMPKLPVTRLNDIHFDLTPFGDGVRALAFGTCADITYDVKHGKVSLVVLSGKGAPLRDLRDIAHPFVLNDVNSWTGGVNARLWGAGYYSTIKPGGEATDIAESVGERHLPGGPVTDQSRLFYWYNKWTKDGSIKVTKFNSEEEVDYNFKYTMPILLFDSTPDLS